MLSLATVLCVVSCGFSVVLLQCILLFSAVLSKLKVNVVYYQCHSVYMLLVLSFNVSVLERMASFSL